MTCNLNVFKNLLTIDLQTCSCLVIKEDVLCCWDLVGVEQQPDDNCSFDELPPQQFEFSSFISVDSPQHDDDFSTEQQPFLPLISCPVRGKATVNALTKAQIHLIHSAEHTVTKTFESKNYKTSSTNNLT